MIDLEQPTLPDAILVDGVEVHVHTSFRKWMRFGRLLSERGLLWGGVLAEPAPEGWGDAALEFYRSENATPRPGHDDGSTAMDMARDGDYIVGSFQSAYGIDLTEGDMHWHRFLALLRSLPEDAKLSKIAGYRTWRKRDAKPETVMRELRREWALPPKERELRPSEGAERFLDANEERIRKLMESGEVSTGGRGRGQGQDNRRQLRRELQNQGDQVRD